MILIFAVFYNPYYEVHGKNGSEVSLLVANRYTTIERLIILESDLLYHPDFLKICLKQTTNTFISTKLSGSGDEVFLGSDYDMKLIFLGKQANEDQKSRSIGEFTGISCIDKNTLSEYTLKVKQRLLNNQATSHYEEIIVKITNGTSAHFIVKHCPKLAWIEIDTPKNLARARDEIWPQISAAYNGIALEENVLMEVT